MWLTAGRCSCWREWGWSASGRCDPLTAIRYQIVVMYMLLAAAAPAALTAARLAERALFDEAHRLRPLAAPAPAAEAAGHSAAESAMSTPSRPGPVRVTRDALGAWPPATSVYRAPTGRASNA